MATNPLPLTVKTPAANSVPNRAQQIARAQAIPSVPGAPPPRERNPLKQFNQSVVVCAFGVPTRLAIQGDYVYIQSATRNPMSPDGTGIGNGTGSVVPSVVAMRDNNNNLVTIDAVGKGYIFPSPFEYIEFISSNDITFIVMIGYGRVNNDSGIRTSVGLSEEIFTAIVRPANVTPYAANQNVNDVSGVVIEFPNCARFPFGNGIITRAKIFKVSPNLVNADFTLFLMPTAGSAGGADQSTYNLSVNQRGLQGIIRFPTFITAGAGSTSSVCEIDGIAVPFRSQSASNPTPPNLAGGGSLFGNLVANGAYVPIASEQIFISLFVDRY